LDGATGTELEARGVESALPLWSAHALLQAPDQVRAVHASYVDAGAEMLTANTFRTQHRTLARAGLAERAGELTSLALELAREAAGKRPIFVAGSASPLEDCYHPERVAEEPALQSEHRAHARNLARAGADVILVESMNCTREAVAAAAAAAETGLPFLVSFICADQPDRLSRLLSGEPLCEAIDAVAPHGPAAVLINCLPASAVPACLPALRNSGLAFGVYANLGAPTPMGGRSEECSPAEYAQHGRDWLRAGASVVGGCCGTTPAHIRALASTRNPNA